MHYGGTHETNIIMTKNFVQALLLKTLETGKFAGKFDIALYMYMK